MSPRVRISSKFARSCSGPSPVWALYPRNRCTISTATRISPISTPTQVSNWRSVSTDTCDGALDRIQATRKRTGPSAPDLLAIIHLSPISSSLTGPSVLLRTRHRDLFRPLRRPAPAGSIPLPSPRRHSNGDSKPLPQKSLRPHAQAGHFKADFLCPMCDRLGRAISSLPPGAARAPGRHGLSGPSGTWLASSSCDPA